MINGDHWYTQEMWSQRRHGRRCVQATQATIADSPLPLPTVNLTQFSPDVSGNIGGNHGALRRPVEVQLIRAGTDRRPIRRPRRRGRKLEPDRRNALAASSSAMTAT